MPKLARPMFYCTLYNIKPYNAINDYNKAFELKNGRINPSPNQAIYSNLVQFRVAN